MDRNAEPGALLVALAATPARFKAGAGRLSEDQLTAAPAPGGWSPNEILWHVRAAAGVYGEHIQRILDEDTPRWRHVSPRARMKKSRYDLVPFADSLAAFEQQRTALLALLREAPPQAWERPALVRLDKQRERTLTLHERIRGMVNHEEVHCPGGADRPRHGLAARQPRRARDVQESLHGRTGKWMSVRHFAGLGSWSGLVK